MLSKTINQTTNQTINQTIASQNSQNTIKPLLMIGALAILGLSLSIPANAHPNSKSNSFLNAIDYLDYQMPKKVSDSCYKLDNCPDVEVQYLDSNQTWINKIANRKIDQIAIDNANSSIENPPKNLTVKQALDNFINHQAQDSQFNFSLEVSPEYLGHINEFELLAINSHVYTGGAHGMPYREYLIFDNQTHQQLTLDTILLANQKKQFKKLAYHAYKQWIKDNVQQDVQNYEQSWNFSFSDNITFTDKGISILYQPYEIAPYAVGMPTLTIEYNKLNGIIKPDILTRLQDH